jgi:hypothetical protein
MLFSPSTLVALGLALSQTAFGLPAPGTTVNKREVFNLPPSDMFVDCGTGYKWARPEIEAAVQLGINSPDRTIGMSNIFQAVLYFAHLPNPNFRPLPSQFRQQWGARFQWCMR